MNLRTGILLIAALAALNIGLHKTVVRWDMTGDKRHTLSAETKDVLRRAAGETDITVYLEGEMNPGFRKLRGATYDLLREMNAVHGRIKVHAPAEEDTERELKMLEQSGFGPVIVHERAHDGQTVQTRTWPYAKVRLKGRSTIVPLLQQHRGLSGEENLNLSTEGLEYAFAEALNTLCKEKVERVAFLEGHGELPAENVYDWSAALSRHFQVDRGVLGTDARMLDGYKAVLIADPQLPFSETDKYILDQYVMQGGRVMWLLNGVKFSGDMLSADGVTPAVALDLRLTDLLFRHGVRINAAIVQDLQCLMVPVDVSRDPQNPQYQPIPWTYAPLLLPSEESPVTHNIMPVSATFASCLDFVGGEDGLRKTVLLCTSTASRLTATPAELDLSDLSAEKELFRRSCLPVAASLEGEFTSLYAHRGVPVGVENAGSTRQKSVRTKQIIAASGSIARNEWQHGQPLPAGYDRYSKTQFGNRDFLLNAVLWLTDDHGLLKLKQKTVALRLLNDKRAHEGRTKIQAVSIAAPLLLLLLTGVCTIIIRKKKYI